MTAFVTVLEKELAVHANLVIAQKQKEYMRNQFEFYGIMTTERRAIFKPFIQKQYLPTKQDLPQILKELWQMPQRDFQMCGVDLLLKYQKQLELEDLEWLEFVITHKSWWDTVDMIATKMCGAYFTRYPELRQQVVDKWIDSGNMWLQRSALLFQLKYKHQTDTNMLAYVIEQLIPSNEFFINKAIGWVLREYSRTNAVWVTHFVDTHELSALSRKEALRLLA